MRIGILGAGNIAAKMAVTVQAMEGVTLYAVGSRDLEKAQNFAREYGMQMAYGSYEELANDEKIDLIYIATPHSHHFEHMKLCISHGRNVLCEKSFTFDAKQTEEIITLAKEKRVYLAEAIWTRYMPYRKMLNDLLESGVIGKVKMLTCNLSYLISQNERIKKPELAGGALLDLGVYGINFVLMHFGKDIASIGTTAVMMDSGVDGQESITFTFKDGRMAVAAHSVYTSADRRGIIYGDKGYIEVDNINNPQYISVFDSAYQCVSRIPVPQQITGYEYEVIESLEQIKQGKTESESMPLSETLYVMKMMDDIRAMWKKAQPQEQSCV